LFLAGFAKQLNSIIMKTTALILALLISVSSVAQVLHSEDQKFVRVFDLNGNKVLKGHLNSVSDSTLTLKFRNELKSMAVTDVGVIKYKRAIGNSVLIGTLVAGGTMAVVGAATAEPDAMFFGYTAGEGAAMGFITGAPVGAAVGGILGLLRKEKYVHINGDVKAWMTFKNNLLAGSF
jgi:hypothetical protein